MSALREVDNDLDQIVVDTARLAEVRKGVAARGKLALAAADAELAALAEGTAPLGTMVRPDTEPPPPRDASVLEDEAPPSGQIDVPDDVLASAELPAVLTVPPQPAAPVEPLSLDFDSGETPFGPEEELAPVATTASMVLLLDAPVPAAPAVDYHAPPTETQPLGDDPNADLASLLGDADPMRDEGAMPLAGSEIEPEPTTMFSAEDAARYSRPPSPLDELEPASDIELEIEEIELDEEIEEDEGEAAPLAAAPRTAPPPPPRTAPPPPPGARPSESPPARGFLGKLLQRKP